MRHPLLINRRNFLLGLGGSMLPIPFLSSLAKAESQGPMKYFISWRLTNGHFGFHWLPADSKTTNIAVVEPNVREMPLANISGSISPILDAGFDRFRSQMLLFRHIDHMSRVCDHGASPALTGWKDKTGNATWNDLNPGINQASLPPSLDQIIAGKIYGSSGRKPPVNLSLNWDGSRGWSCSYTKNAQTGVFEGQPGLYPQQAYSLLFADFGGTTTTARRRGYRGAVIDLVKSHYQSVRANPKLSSYDKGILDQYIEEMYQLGQRLASSTSSGGCAVPGAAPPYSAQEIQVNPAAAAQVDIAVAAIKCGLTRVVNMYLDPDTVMPGIGGKGHHGLSHNSDQDSIDGILACHRWNFGYLKSLLNKLEDSIDPSNGKSYLHNSLVLVTNEIGNQGGQNANDPSSIDGHHEGFDIQTAIFGTANGYLRTGYYLDYRTPYTRHRWSKYAGIAYNRLLVTAMLAMGLSPSDWEVGGQPGFGSLRGGQYDSASQHVVVGDMRAPLPRTKA